eukprot:gene10959-biopygen15814
MDIYSTQIRPSKLHHAYRRRGVSGGLITDLLGPVGVQPAQRRPEADDVEENTGRERVYSEFQRPTHAGEMVGTAAAVHQYFS